jgi:hypothetical protein
MSKYPKISFLAKKAFISENDSALIFSLDIAHRKKTINHIIIAISLLLSIENIAIQICKKSYQFNDRDKNYHL